MPEGKIIPTSPGEYPELDGLKQGAQVDFEGTARLVEGGLEIVSMNLNPSDNEATTELNRMTGREGMMSKAPAMGKSGGF